MPVKHSTACMHRSRNHAGLLPLRMRETPAREAARAYRIEAREQTETDRHYSAKFRSKVMALRATKETQRVTWNPAPPRVRGPHLHLNTSGQRRVQRQEKARIARIPVMPGFYVASVDDEDYFDNAY